MWLIRCNLAMWLDKWKDRIETLAEWVSPDETAWNRYDDYARRMGYYDWYLKDQTATKK